MTQPTQQAVIRRFLVAGLWLPVTYTAIALIWQLTMLPNLPDPIAVHWGANGQANGFGPAWLNLVLTGVIGLGVPLAFSLSILPALRRGERGPSFRFIGAMSGWLSMLIASLATLTMAMQQGLTDASASPTVGLPLIGSFLLAILAGALGWFTQPQQHSVAQPTVTATPLSLAPGEHVAWMRETSLSRLALTLLLGLTILVLVLALWVLSTTELPQALVVLVAPVVLVFALATSAAFRVRVNEQGLSVSSVAGWPRFRVPLNDITDVAVVSVNPLGTFGGWGLRWVPGKFAVVLRIGEGIQVTRRSGRQFVVTVDDAGTGAAALAALAQRARQHTDR